MSCKSRKISNEVSSSTGKNVQMVHTVFARPQSATGSICSPVGFDSEKQSCWTGRDALHPALARMQWEYVPCTLVAFLFLWVCNATWKKQRDPVLLCDSSVYFQPDTPVWTLHNWAGGIIQSSKLHPQWLPPKSWAPHTTRGCFLAAETKPNLSSVFYV